MNMEIIYMKSLILYTLNLKHVMIKNKTNKTEIEIDKNVYNDSFYRIKKQINCDSELKIDKTYKINNKRQLTN